MTRRALRGRCAGVVDVECGGGLTSGELDQIAAAGNAED